MSTQPVTFEKILCLGSEPLGSGDRAALIYAKVQYDGKRISFTGVVGPLRNGDARGSAGQIIMSYREYDKRGYLSLADIVPAKDWNPGLIREFFDAWNRWHLNDMRAGCEHQREWPTGEELEIITYRLTPEAFVERRAVEGAIQISMRANGTAAITDDERAILNLPMSTHAAPDADGPGSGRYEVDKRETKTAGWVFPSEHPRGLLTKPCDVCGHKYGSTWRFEPVPEDVLEWLRALPDTQSTPAWI